MSSQLTNPSQLISYPNNLNLEDINSESDITPEEIAICMICQQIPEDYITLSCTHNFCLFCLANTYANSEKCQKNLQTGEAEITCEIC